MLKITKTVLPSADQWQIIIEGMRNPLNSWDKSDSSFTDEFIMGQNDLKLMKQLAKAGDEHAKYLRMIPVTATIIAPIFWLAELDTYKIGVTRNSCSFMHKGVSKPFELSDFSRESDADDQWWKATIDHLNKLRDEYLAEKDDSIFREIRSCLPSGYLQRSTFQFNYATLRNIYRQRKNHRLPEWHTFCHWIESLPYSELITGRSVEDAEAE